MKQMVIVLLLAAIAHPASLAAPAAGEETGADAYEFPVQPGTAAWKELRTYDDKLAVCQVPEDVLGAMSTPGLVQTCLMYPLAYDFLAFGTLDQGIDRVISGFNGLQELMARKDGASALLAAYRSMVPGKSYLLQWEYVEGLLGREAVRNRLTAQERIDLLTACRANAMAMRGDPDFGIISLEAIGSLMGRLLIDANYAPFMRDCDASEDLKGFLKGRGSRDTFDVIVSSVDRYLAETAEKGGKQ